MVTDQAVRVYLHDERLAASIASRQHVGGRRRAGLRLRYVRNEVVVVMLEDGQHPCLHCPPYVARLDNGVGFSVEEPLDVVQHCA